MVISSQQGSGSNAHQTLEYPQSAHPLTGPYLPQEVGMHRQANLILTAHLRLDVLY